MINIGYTHYTYRNKILNKKKFKAVVADFQKVLPILKKVGVELAGWNGEGKPEITETKIRFNGVEKCGHIERNLGIAWAGKGATGVALATETKPTEEAETILTMLSGETEQLSLNDSDVAGQWFAGAELKARTCGGDCSHETFSLPQSLEPSEWQKPQGRVAYIGQDGKEVLNPKKEIGMYFAFCKTAFKPYDLAVNCVLIIAKHHFGSDIIVRSDGESEDWEDGRKVCQKVLGYGKEFRLDEETR